MYAVGNKFVIFTSLRIVIFIKEGYIPARQGGAQSAGISKKSKKICDAAAVWVLNDNVVINNPIMKLLFEPFNVVTHL